jgi:5-enolpyruvylshikimate-3-phosphate synthase
VISWVGSASGSRAAPTISSCDSHGDHRVAMAGAIAANALEGETVVRNWRAVTSSYPEFTQDLATLTGRAGL